MPRGKGATAVTYPDGGERLSVAGGGPTPAPEPARAEVPPEERRHQAQLRMLGHVKDAIVEALGELDRRSFFRGLALSGYNANPNPKIGGADPGLKARWAEADAEALLAVGSDET